jgi:hypothetical protein
MRLKLILFLSVLVLVVSCNKWKQPTDTQFYVDINRTPTIGGQLTFTGGQMILSNFEFEGEREKGGDVSFITNYGSGLTIPFDLTNTNPELNFDIPQGVYNRIALVLTTGSSGEVILVEGTYAYNGGGTVPFRFIFADTEEFEIEAEDDDGGTIVLDKDAISPAKIVLDPTHWFAPVPSSFFENATLTDVNGVNTIVIDKNNNEDIYDIVLDRLEETAAVIFNY